MTTLTGELTLVGQGVTNIQSGYDSFSVVRVGGHTLRNVVVHRGVASFLQPGAVQEVFVHRFLFVLHPIVIGVRWKDGAKEVQGWWQTLRFGVTMLALGVVVGGVAAAIWEVVSPGWMSRIPLLVLGGWFGAWAVALCADVVRARVA
jgi:hypothetical protein